MKVNSPEQKFTVLILQKQRHLILWIYETPEKLDFVAKKKGKIENFLQIPFVGKDAVTTEQLSNIIPFAIF